MIARPLLALVAVAVLAAPALAHGADAPEWLTRAARLPASPLEAGADAVVLMDEMTVVVGTDGRVVTRRTYAVRVLKPAGSRAARLREVYVTDSSQVRQLRGWVLSDGRTTELGRDETIDAALADNDVYNESRVRVLGANGPLPAGAVFGAESEVSERTVFSQLEWALQGEWPIQRIRRTLTLPPGGTITSTTFNRSPIEPSRDGGSYAWGLDNLSALPDEDSAPPTSSLAPRVAVSYTLRAGEATPFDTWATVSTWLASLGDPRAAATPALTAKARELTAGAATDLDRIRAVARFAQRVQYISVQTGLGRGGGYTPHNAADVLARNYGDCKDKANLVRALLATLGIRAHLVAIYSGDPGYVRAEWPSPQQFNHAIAAIAVGPDVTAPAVAADAPGGRLLYFDPTDEHTPLGELPLHLQGSQGLIVMPTGGGLVRMPSAPAGANPRIRQVDATLTAAGALTATITQTTAGDAASTERALYRELSRDAYLRMLEADVRRQVPGASLTLSTLGDDDVANQFQTTTRLEAAAYAQLVQNRLLIVRPPEMMARRPLPAVGRDARKTSIVIDARDERDTFILVLADGLSVDDLPAPQTVTAPFGRFSVTWQSAPGRLTRSVSLQINRATMPAESGSQVAAFFDAFREAERLPAVLIRQ